MGKGKKEKHYYVEDDIMAREQIEKGGKIIWHITQHRLLLKFYDMMDICLLAALITVTVKITLKLMQLLPW
jgi:hypothetical protein